MNYNKLKINYKEKKWYHNNYKIKKLSNNKN